MWPWSRPAAPALPDPKEACTFCKRPRAQVAQLVAGDVASICDECVLLSVRVLMLDVPPEDARGSPFLHRLAFDVAASLPEDTRNELSGPWLEAATRLAASPLDRAKVGREASRLSHARAAADALVGPGSTPTMLANAVAFLILLGEAERALALLRAVDPAPLAPEDRAHRSINLASAALATGAPEGEVEQLLAQAEQELRAAEGSRLAAAWWACIDTSRGELAMRRGDPALALTCYERAFTRPEHPGPSERWHIGDALFALGRPAEARAAWTEALAALHPDHPRAEKLHRRLAESDTLDG